MKKYSIAVLAMIFLLSLSVTALAVAPQNSGGANSQSLKAPPYATDRILLQLTDTTNLEVACTMSITRPVHVGYDIDEFLKVLHRSRIDKLGIHDADAKWYFHQCALTKIRRHGDFVNGNFRDHGL